MESDFIKSIKKLPEDATSLDENNRKNYISVSRLKMVKKSPAHYLYAEEEDKEETEAMIFGSAYHCYVLEPGMFDERYFVFDDRAIISILLTEGSQKPRATKQYKEWAEGQEIQAQGKIMLDLATMNTIKEMREVLMSHRYVASLLTGGEAEPAYFVEINTADNQSVKIKFRPDYVKPKKRAVIDLKTAKSSSKEKFPLQAADMDYHLQAALYSDLLEKLDPHELPWTFFFIAQEKVKPYAFNIFECSPQFISQGRYEYELLIMLWKYCSDNNFWPGYQVWCENKFGIIELKLPAWAIREVNYYIHK